ncbi:MAG: sigma-E processing peptidase SpoIIGA [Faecousia sp.]
MEIYLDLVVILNFLVDFLLLLGTNRLSGFPMSVPRAAAAAALGALYSGACIWPRLRFLGGILWRAVSLAGMAVIAFGFDRSAIKRGGVFVLLSMALGGVALSVGQGNFFALVLAAGGVWALCRIAFGGQVGGREYVPVELSHDGKTASIVALRDSGNTLRDPITGEQVLVIAGEVAEKLTGLTQKQLRSPLETLMRHPVPGLRLIPYRAVGQAGDMLLAMRFAKVKIGSKEQSVVVAFAPEGLGRGDVYQALTGGVI